MFEITSLNRMISSEFENENLGKSKFWKFVLVFVVIRGSETTRKSVTCWLLLGICLRILRSIGLFVL